MVPDEHRPHGDNEGDSEIVNHLVPLKAKIKDIRTETSEVKTYTLSLEKRFVMQPGQVNMIGYPGVGEAPISISSLVSDGYFDHTIKAVGRVTRFIDTLRKGNYLFLRGPYGKGWPMDVARQNNILLVAGGIGLAPLKPVIQMIMQKRNFFGEVTLIYGARNEESFLFTNDFERWRKGISLHLTVDEILHPDAWRGRVGLVTDLVAEVEIDPDKTFAFVCGPEVMMRFVCRGIALRNVPPSRIYISMERRMKCGIGHCGHCQHYGLFVCKDGPIFPFDRVRGLPDGML
ncbi:MAG: FAD/NAD(P)-binding protein [Nitrospirota bacterium]